MHKRRKGRDLDKIPQDNGHVDPQAIDGFALGTVSVEESNRISHHLARCPKCRSLFIERMKTIELPDVTTTTNNPNESEPKDTPQFQTNGQGLPKIPGFHSVERLAQGGMGTVYLAIEIRTNKAFAVKCVSRTANPSKSERNERLIREAHALTKLDHPHIVGAFEVILVQDSPALVMEYIPGISLHRWSKLHSASVRTIVELMLQLTDAVEYAHRRGVIHCDLKPQNVIVTGDDARPHLKIIDFGLAKLVDETWDITYSGDVLGSPAYMAPERFTGDPLCATPQLDVYGLGAILYELLCGHPPYESERFSDLLSKIGRENPKPLRDLRSDMPIPLEYICMHCLEKYPQDRYDSARSLALDLQAFLDSKPVRARPPKFLRRTARTLTTYRGFSITAALATFVVLVGVWILFRTTQSKNQLQNSLQVAEARVEKAQSTALEELRNSLEETSERLFGATPEKEDAEHQALQRIAERWQRFAASIDDTIEGQLVRAEANLRLGSINRILGEANAANEKFTEVLAALSLLKQAAPRDPRTLSLLAEVNWERAKNIFDSGNSMESNQLFREANAYASQAIELEETSTSSRFLLARILRDYGVMLTRIGKLDEARSQIDASMHLLESILQSKNQDGMEGLKSPKSERVMEQIWSNRIANAVLLRMRGEPLLGVNLLGTIKDEFKESKPNANDDSIALRLFSIHHFTLGTCYLDAGRYPQAKSEIIEATQYQKKLLDLLPRRADLRKNYGSYLGTLAVISIRLQEYQSAIEYITEALTIHSELAAYYPERPEYRIEKFKSMSNLIATLALLNRFSDATKYGEELMKLQVVISNESREQAELAYTFATSSHILAQVHTTLNQFEEATALLRQSQSTYLQLIESSPNVAAYHLGLANSKLLHGEITSRNLDWTQAIDAYANLIHEICSKRSFAFIPENLLLAKAYLGQALASRELGDSRLQRICTELARDILASRKDKDPVSLEIYNKSIQLLNELQSAPTSD
jgi:serine/threonine protein kinase